MLEETSKPPSTLLNKLGFGDSEEKTKQQQDSTIERVK